MEELKAGWRLENLEENLEVILDYRGKTPQKSEKGRVTLSAKSVKMGYIDYSNIYYVSEETYSKFMTRGLPKKGDILLTTEAPLGCVAELKDDSVCLAQRLITLRGKKEKLNNKYLLYYLQSPRGQYELLSKATGTTVQGIKRTEFSKVKILMPSLEKQNKIASILSSLDEKIELNRKINQNLEETAQTLFKRWFIDFEFPNEEGKPYKSSGGKMIESELGEIPEGWRVGKLGEIIEIFDSLRKPLSKKERDLKEKLYPYYGAAGIIDYVDEYSFDGEYILLGEDGTVVSEKGTPILNFIQEKFWVSNHAHVISEKNKDNSYLYYLLKNTDIRHIITGAVQPKINQKNLIELKVTISQEELVKKFSNIISNITLKIRNNQKEIKKLTELRDYLLPRLMSGEISV